MRNAFRMNQKEDVENTATFDIGDVCCEAKIENVLLWMVVFLGNIKIYVYDFVQTRLVLVDIEEEDKDSNTVRSNEVEIDDYLL